jgi:hypothetical protein
MASGLLQGHARRQMARGRKGQMIRISTYLIASIFYAAAAANLNAAQYSVPRVREVETKSGVPVFVGGFIDCKDHVPFEGTSFVQHGTVTMKRLTIKQCGNPNEPATAYWYVSNPGYKGFDEVNFSYVSGSAMIVHITVH